MAASGTAARCSWTPASSTTRRRPAPDPAPQPSGSFSDGTFSSGRFNPVNGGITGTANPGVYAGETAGTLVMQVPLADVATRRRGLPDQHAGRFPWDALRRGPHHLGTGESEVLGPDARALGR